MNLINLREFFKLKRSIDKFYGMESYPLLVKHDACYICFRSPAKRELFRIRCSYFDSHWSIGVVEIPIYLKELDEIQIEEQAIAPAEQNECLWIKEEAEVMKEEAEMPKIAMAEIKITEPMPVVVEDLKQEEKAMPWKLWKCAVCGFVIQSAKMPGGLNIKESHTCNGWSETQEPASRGMRREIG